jgi:hypothetical protein
VFSSSQNKNSKKEILHLPVSIDKRFDLVLFSIEQSVGESIFVCQYVAKRMVCKWLGGGKEK